MKYVFDMEADGMLEEATKMWCASFLNWDTGRVTTVYTPQDCLDVLLSADKVIGHNITGYDFPLLLKLLRPSDEEIVNRLTNPSLEWCSDTYEMSVALQPERPGGHSVEAWAKRLGEEGKIEINDWKNLSRSKYVERCEHDVYLESLIYHKLNSEIRELLKD